MRDLAPVFIVLPAYNEAGNMDDLLRQIAEVPALGQAQVLVVDDGSHDGTGEIARGWQNRLALEVLVHPVNAGLGVTLRDGIAHAVVAARDAAAVVVTLDADGSHLPRQIPDLLAALSEGADVAIASRYRQGAAVRGVPRYRQVLSGGARLLGQAVLRVPGVRDYTCGFRAYRVALLRQALSHHGERFIREPGFAASLEILLKLARFRPVVREIPLDLRYDVRESASKMRVGRTVAATLRVMARHLLVR